MRPFQPPGQVMRRCLPFERGVGQHRRFSSVATTSVEFRFLSGNSMWFPYSWLGPWRYDPSEGLLLKFSATP